MTTAALALERAYRDERAAVLAGLTRRLAGDLALAEDALQDALLAAAVDGTAALLRAARAELLRRSVDSTRADLAYARAIALSGNGHERVALERRRAELAADPG